MTSVRERVEQLLGLYGGERSCTAELLCDVHPEEAVAFTVVEPDLSSRQVTFGELADRSARLAGGLAELGVGPGDRVATLMGKSAELVEVMLAIWRLGAVQVPLFTAFAPPAIAARIGGNGTKVVITDPSQRPKLDSAGDLGIEPSWRVVTTGAPSGTEVGFENLLTVPRQPTPEVAGGDAPIVELFTSGTTGRPKGVSVPLRAVAAMRMYQEYGLDHQAHDVFWNAADPGWAYGLYHGIVGPLALGRASLLLRGAFSAERTWSVLSRFGVTNFAAGPTVYRALRTCGRPAPTDLRLRHCSSAGEPLTADVTEWAQDALGVPVLDHYGQTELGMVAASPWHPELSEQAPGGSMGRALPGWRLQVLRPDREEIAEPGEAGRIAVDITASPLMWFTGYSQAADSGRDRFTPEGRWYLTGDTGTSDKNGFLHFAARDDDVIIMAGYRIGPTEVEGVLLQHPAVGEAAVVAAPDELRGEVLVAYVVPREGHATGDDLAAELQQLVKTRFAAHAYPRQVYFVPSLPRTPSGKLQRFLLRRADTTAASGGSRL